MSRLALSGGAYEARSLVASAQRAVNLVAEPLPEGQGEPSRFAHYPTPGLRLLSSIGPGPIRGIRQATTGSVYVVSGSGVYAVNTSSWAGTLLGSITAGLHTPVSMADNGLDLVIVDGTANGWTVSLAGNTFAAISDPNGMFTGADRVDYLDTYLLFNKTATPQFYISGSLAVDFDPLDFANKSTYPDLLVTLAVAKRDVYLLGERTTEIWYDAGATDIGAGSFPFAQTQGVFIDHGIIAKYSVANYDNGLFWLSRDRQGQGIVLEAADYKTKRVSTYAIEAEISGYSRIDDAVGYCYALGGHAFYVLSFPHADHTWAYDITTGLWHEWVWIDTNGAEHRHRSNCHAAVSGLNVVGDWQTGNLYALDGRVYTDNGQPIKRVRSFPHVLADGRRVFYRQFLADIETGNPGSPPVITSRVEVSVTWPPQIAQMTGVAVGPVVTTEIDWQRGFVYFVGQTGIAKYTTALETQTVLASSTPAGTTAASPMAVDPLTGVLLQQRYTTAGFNANPILKLDPNTFAVLDSFGGSTSFPSYPTSVWQGQEIVCVVCNGVSFGFLKYSELFGTVAGFRVDTMEHSGFIADIVSGSTDNRGSMCAGASGGSAASVFLSWDATTTPAPAVPLYRIDIAASATAYNPATWPTTNPGITWSTVGTIAVAAVNPAWTGFTVYSLGYDLADGNVLMLAGTTSSADGYRVLKLSALTAAVVWNIAIGTSLVDLGGSRIDGSLWFFRNVGFTAGPTSSYRINTLTGTMETLPISGVFANSDVRQQQTDSETSTMFFGGTYASSIANGPVPVEGTSFFTGGWATMGGQTSRIITTGEGGVDGDLISLSASYDRGHSWGNPVSQSIGLPGEYRKSLQWRRLGMGRDAVFKLEWSAPLATALQGAWIDAEPGDGGQEKK